MCCIKLIQPLNNVKYSLHANAIGKRKFSDLCNEVIEYNYCSTPSIRLHPCVEIPPQPEAPKRKPKPSSGGKILECCIKAIQTCDDGHPFRHDLNLKSTHWSERKYQRTWYEIPKMIIGKKICKFEKTNVPEPEIRARGAGNPDAQMRVTLSDCYKIEKYEQPCPTCIKHTNCKEKAAECCRKRCTMYPSYSECCKPSSKSPRSTECLCKMPTSLCMVNQFLAERGLLVKSDDASK